MVRNTKVDHFGPLWSVDKPAMFGHFWSKMDHFRPSPVMKSGPKSKKKMAHHYVSYVWPACGTPKRPFWNINMAPIHEKCQNSMKKWPFLPLSCHEWQIMCPKEVFYPNLLTSWEVQDERSETIKKRQTQSNTKNKQTTPDKNGRSWFCLSPFLLENVIDLIYELGLACYRASSHRPVKPKQLRSSSDMASQLNFKLQHFPVRQLAGSDRSETQSFSIGWSNILLVIWPTKKQKNVKLTWNCNMTSNLVIGSIYPKRI